MNFSLHLPSYPLLVKDLREWSARRRLYALRVIWALALAAMVLITMNNVGDSQHLLGQGGRLLDAVFWTQLAAILVVMPAATAGTLAQERENGSLPLLLLTPLGIWRVLLEKWLSRVVVGVQFLLIGLPFMAVAFAYGGFAPERLAIDGAILVVTCMQVAAIGLAVSALSRDTVTAFIGAYLAVPEVIAAAAWICAQLCEPGMPLSDAGIYRNPLVLSCLPMAREVLLLPMPGYGYYNYLGSYNTMPSNNVTDTFWSRFSLSLTMIALFQIIVPLAIARIFALRTAAASGPSWMRRAFHAMDHWAERGDARLGLRHRRSLPDDQPLAWRARRGRALTGLRYQVRLLLAGGVLIVVGGILVAGQALDPGGLEHRQMFVQTALLALVTLVLLVQGAGLFASERAAGTIEVLLTTPLTALDILRQKLVGLNRIWAAFAILMLLGAGVEALIVDHLDERWIKAAVDAVVLPFLAMWIGIAVGLRVHQRHRAAAVALAILVGWMIAGELILAAATGHDALTSTETAWWYPTLSPVAHPLAVLGNLYPSESSWGSSWDGPVSQTIPDDPIDQYFKGFAVTLMQLLVCGGMITYLRWSCFRNVDGALRR
jgi:ABC-type transport system involved in multi-copper enzyme maturation permease subunit